MTERILVVTPWFPSPGHEGAGLFNLRDTLLIAADSEIQVLHLIRPDWYSDADRQPVEGVSVKRVPFSAASPRTWMRAGKEISDAMSRTDVLHTMAFPALIPFAGKKVDAPWIHTEHWSGLVSKSAPLFIRTLRAVLQPLLRRPDQVVAVGTSLAEAIDRVRGNPSTVIANFVRIAPRGQLPSVFEMRQGEPLRILSVGSLIPTKGPIQAVEMLAVLRANGIDATLEWAGTGPLKDFVLSRARELGVGQNLLLLGQLSPEKLSTHLLRANLFVLPTQIETFGVAIAEALGHGLPVISSGRGGHEEFLRPECSRIVSVRSGEALAAAAQELLNDPALWRPEEIHEYALTLFSEERRRRAYANVYKHARLNHHG